MSLWVFQFIRSQLFTTLPKVDASFAGQTVIVTGSNTGLGQDAARQIVALGAEKVIIAVRNVAAGTKAAEDIAASTGRSGVCDVWALDLSSFKSIKDFAARAERELPRLDAVLENAGLATRDFQASPEADGIESTIAINVVGTFLLGLLLLPKLRETGRKVAGVQPRLTIVASDVHGMATFSERKHDPIFPALSDPATSNMPDRYPVSKLLEIMVVRQIAPIMGSADAEAVSDPGFVRLNCMNPGLCQSELLRNSTGILSLILGTMKFVLGRSTEVGGGLLVGALAAPLKTHGKYMSDGVVWEPDAERVRSDEAEQTAKRVWAELKAILEKIQPGVTDNLKG